MQNRVLDAARELQDAQAEFDGTDGAPTDNERRQLAGALFLLQEELRSIQRRAGVSTLRPRNQAPDWSTRMAEVREIIGDAIDTATNYRAGTEGPGLSAARQGVDSLRRARQEFQRAGVESIAG
jgi:hypothetical protein